MIKKLQMVFASSNAGKIKEMKYLLDKNINRFASNKFDVELLSLKDIGFTSEIIEYGKTFEENAEIKADTVYDFCKIALKKEMICFADDSGLCVDYLKGAPGIYSARYSGGNDDDNITKLLDELKDVPDAQRAAHFTCAIICIIPPFVGAEASARSQSLSMSADWHGFIARERMGENGFGYDPIFYYPQLKMTSAQLPGEIKNKVSHRALAAEQLAREIVELYIN